MRAALVAVLLGGCVLPGYDNVGDDLGPAVACDDTATCGGAPCVDGYCCDRPCAGPCEQCGRAGFEGTCTASDVGTDPEHECGGYTCDGAGACATGCDEATPACAITHGCVEGACTLQRPRQTVAASAASTQLPLEIAVDTTLPRSTLVLVAAVSTTSQRITSVTDSGGNTWMAAVAALPATGEWPSTEIWIAADAAPVSSIWIAIDDPRDLAVRVSEWTGLQAIGVLDRSTANPGATSTAASSGTVAVTANRDLVIAAMSSYGTSTTTLDGVGGFSALPTTDLQYLHCHSAYLVGGPGSHEATWTLSQAVNWTGGAVSLVAR